MMGEQFFGQSFGDNGRGTCLVCDHDQRLSFSEKMTYILFYSLLIWRIIYAVNMLKLTLKQIGFLMCFCVQSLSNQVAIARF